MSDFAKVEQSLREEMTRIASSFFQRGYATGSAGNLSLLLPDGNLLATPTGSCLGNLDPQRLSKVAADGEWLSGDKPSKEVLFHLALYRNNPRCKAVVHLHSTWSTALSCLQGLDSSNVIRPFTPYVVMRMGNVPLVPYYRPGDKRIAQDLAELAADNQAFLLANHGVRVWFIIARSIVWRIHQVAYVEKRKPRSGSNFSTARISPRLPSSIRSSNARPRLP